MKAASELYSPVTGQVVTVNESLEDRPGLINKSPEGEGWLFTLEVDHDFQDGLLNRDQYEEFLKSQTDDLD